MKLTAHDLLDVLSTPEWELVHAKLRSAQLALRITADQAYDNSDWDAKHRAQQTEADLAALAAAV
jgi:hypothetical protein